MTTKEKFPQLELEALIDHWGAHTVLAELADIAYGKSEHLRSNWQDEPAARLWAKLGRRLCTVADWAMDNMP